MTIKLARYIRDLFSRGKRVLFLTTNDYGFGGSEEMWSLTAMRMSKMGFSVGVSVRAWEPEPARIKELGGTTCTIFRRSVPCTDAERGAILEFNPDLVVISQGSNFESLDWMRFLSENRLRYMNVIHCVHEASWPSIDDLYIERMNELYGKSLRIFFVSEGNRRLHEKMSGVIFENAEIVRNPFKVRYSPELSWPSGSPNLNVACVGRLECFHKGGDVLLEVLSREKWKNRPVKFRFYGDGPHRRLLQRLCKMWDIRNVSFEGHTENIEGVWESNHALIQPSRLEGLPLSVVEAMLCDRLVIATDVAGHREVIDDGAHGFIAECPSPNSLDEAMERAWMRKEEWQKIGKEAGRHIRTLVPEDPIGVFISKIENFLK